MHVAGLNQVIAQSEHGFQGYWMGNLKTDTGEEIRIAFNILKLLCVCCN